MDIELSTLISEVTHLTQEYQTNLTGMNNPTLKARLLSKNDEIALNIRAIRDEFVTELRDVDMEPEERQPYQVAMRDLLRDFKLLQRECDLKRNEMTRDEVVCEPQAVPQTYQDVAQVGDDLQDKTQEAITRMQGYALEAEDVGIATDAKMAGQIQQMGAIDEGFGELHQGAKAARATMRQIAKGACADRCIQVLCGLNLVTLVVCIVMVSI
ncbi:MAG: uncharacterized protein KVP18_000877 [Porospora cf. gigantea A]|uniref:uncharacterized protein n=1 Tax=Porospora cf. gigantea A TaxID=2853593 RepID=UPI0035595B95|nr:MAG: hypothetical protein KVP18_000877 [Porospora cf. gigantea A]